MEFSKEEMALIRKSVDHSATSGQFFFNREESIRLYALLKRLKRNTKPRDGGKT